MTLSTKISATLRGSARTFLTPLVGLVVLISLATLLCAMLALQGEDLSDGSATLYSVAFGYLVAVCVDLDRKARKLSGPYEYAAFVFAVWWVFLPIYLFQTRRWRGLAITLVLLFASSFPFLVAYGVYELLAQ